MHGTRVMAGVLALWLAAAGLGACSPQGGEQTTPAGAPEGTSGSAGIGEGGSGAEDPSGQNPGGSNPVGSGPIDPDTPVSSDGRMMPPPSSNGGSGSGVSAGSPGGADLQPQATERFRLVRLDPAPDAFASPAEIVVETEVEPFRITLEDGHDELANVVLERPAGEGTADGRETTIRLEFKRPTSPHGTLYFSYRDPKTGAWQRDLTVPIAFDPAIVSHSAP